MSRISRVAQQIQQTLSTLIQTEVTDPRVSLVTVSMVKLSNDMNNAKVYISTLGDVDDITRTVQVLNKAAAFLRRNLAKSLQLRVTPQLRFFVDESFVFSEKISKGLHGIKDNIDSDNDSSEQ